MSYTNGLDNPELYMQVKLYTGNGSTPSITLDGDTDMQPDMVWIKNRDATDSHCLFDSVRTATEVIHSDATTAETTDADTLTSFDSDGFALGADVKVNTDTEAYVAWCWKESATSGFDIVTYTGNGSNRTIAHGLSAKPAMIFVKQTSATRSWWVYNKNLDGTDGATGVLYLNTTDAAGTNATTSWNSTAPTTSVFSLGTTVGVNQDTGTYIAYLFSPVQGFSKFGSYTGNGNADGTFIYTGFRPAFVMFKKSSSTSSWWIGDSKRDVDNVVQQELYADTSSAENTESGGRVDFLSNGFKHRNSGGSGNTSGATYIYMAFAEAPFVNSNGVPCNAR